MPVRTFSSTVMAPKMRMFWKVRAMPRAARRYDGMVVMSVPAKLMVPSLGITRPETRLNSVVLPAPFGPMTAWMPPSGMVSST